MAETTGIAVLMRDMRDLADRIVECQGENSNGEEIIHLYDQSDTTFKAQNILLVLNAFEAERQRADANEPVRCEGVPQHVHDMIDLQETIDELRAELSALKGVQVPVAWRHDSDILCHKVVTMSEVVAKSWVDKGRSVTPLYDRPQKSVVLPPLRTRDDYQSRLGNGDIGPYNHGHLEGWNAAIGAAGGWVCTSDERLMQDMSGIVVEPHFREISNSSTGTFRENLETSTNCPKCGGSGSYHCPQMLGTVECECSIVKTEAE